MSMTHDINVHSVSDKMEALNVCGQCLTLGDIKDLLEDQVALTTQVLHMYHFCDIDDN